MVSTIYVKTANACFRLLLLPRQPFGLACTTGINNSPVAKYVLSLEAEFRFSFQLQLNSYVRNRAIQRLLEILFAFFDTGSPDLNLM